MSASGAGDPALLRATFQVIPGLGPRRERALWEAGVRSWSDWTEEEGAVPPALHPVLRTALGEMEAALDAGDLPRLAARIPTAEQWRLFARFAEDAVYLDIETDEEEGITAIGLLDRHGPRILLAGRDLDRFPAQVDERALLVTFNGSCFDVPVLRRRFPDWSAPPAHVDLRHVWTRLGHRGGLKALEEQVGIPRPDHLRGMDGAAAVWLWRHARHGDRNALRIFAEYNLYDTINLRTLMGLAYNRSLERLGLPLQTVAVGQRGDVLYDVSRELLRIAPP